jgi:hypothetical protein
VYFDSTCTAEHLTTHRGIYCPHVEQSLGTLSALMGFLDSALGLLGVLPASDFGLVIVRDGGLPAS